MLSEKIPLPCEISPCFNGGACNNIEGTAVCRCVNGFGGLSCQSGKVIYKYMQSVNVIHMSRKKQAGTLRQNDSVLMSMRRAAQRIR